MFSQLCCILSVMKSVIRYKKCVDLSVAAPSDHLKSGDVHFAPLCLNLSGAGNLHEDGECHFFKLGPGISRRMVFFQVYFNEVPGALSPRENTML